jgi:hypothetical protein
VARGIFASQWICQDDLVAKCTINKLILYGIFSIIHLRAETFLATRMIWGTKDKIILLLQN